MCSVSASGAMTFSAPAFTSISWWKIILLLSIALAVVGQDSLSILKKDSNNYKTFTGLRVREDSIRQVYYHDQTIAVVELGPDRLLYGCELIEVNYPQTAKAALRNLTSVAKPITITFQDMTILMQQCHDLHSAHPSPEDTPITQRRNSVNPFSLLSGILPGTKWCGTGDIAKHYFDLGPNVEVDKCCRTHDLCPVKIQGLQSRYNLTNLSIYSKSHCDCDSMLYHCLKSNKNNQIANLLGVMYFNVIKVPCIEESCGKSDYTEKCQLGSEVQQKKRFRSQVQDFKLALFV